MRFIALALKRKENKTLVMVKNNVFNISKRKTKSSSVFCAGQSVPVNFCKLLFNYLDFLALGFRLKMRS